MANRFLVKRSAVTTNVPTTGQLELGEIAINTFDGKMFIKKDNGAASVVEIGSAAVSVPNAVAHSTGVITGGVLSIGSPTTTFSISDGTGMVVDNTVTPATVTQVSWTGKTNITATYVAAGLVSYAGIDSAGNVVQQLANFTNAQRRQYIVLGSLIHVNLTNLDAVDQQAEIAISPLNQLGDLSDGLGKFNVTGNVFSANGANLNLNKSAGTIYAHGSNWANSASNPNLVSLASLTALSFQYRFSTGTNGTTGIDINPNIYDVAGVSTAVPSNKVTIQRIYSFVSNNVKIQPGQTIYHTLAEAKSAIQTEVFVTEPSIAANGILRGFLILHEGATSLTSATSAFFYEAAKFNGQSGIGGQSVSSLQNAYDNSLDPEILTDATRAAVSIKRGSGADTDNILEGLNGAGTTTFTLKGNGAVAASGAITGSNLSGTNTGDQTSIVGITGTIAQFNTAITDGDLATGGGTATGTNTGDQTITLTGGVTGSGTGSFAATVVTNANLTGGVTSVGNAATVITNADLTGVVTSTGNATAIADNALSIAKTSGLQTALDGKQPIDAALTALAAGSDFVQFTGPASSTKVFTLPDASSTILTTNSVVTAAQGGTSTGTYTTGDILYASAANTLSKLPAGTVNYVLTSGGAGVAPTWAVGGGPGSTAYTEYPFTATASQTTFAVGVTLTLVNVFLNGLRLLPTTDYSISGTNIVLTTGAAVNDILVVLVYSNSAVGGTVTSVAAITLGTTGTDLSSTVATGTTTPVITLQVPTASASNRGALSAADWTTFSNKGNGTVTAVSVATANGVSGSSSGGATPALTIALGAITPSAVQVSGLTASEILSTDASKNLTSLAVATYPSLAELAYVKGVTSAIQTQINAKGAGTVTTVGFTGGLISVATPTTTPALTVAGTSGGIPYFSGATTWATSAALAANALVVGGGAGVAPSTVTTGTDVLTALGVAIGSAGAPVTFNGALGTPSSGTVTNLTGTASININGTVGATTPTTVVGTTGVFGSATSLLLGTAGSAVGSVGFRNATSGTITVSPVAGALGTVTLTLPAATDTIAVLATSQAFTNKTYNGNTWTAGTGVLTLAAGKTLTANNSITLAGTDATTMTFPTTSATIARTDAANTFTGVQTMTSPNFTTPVLGTVTSGVISACTSTSMVMVTPVLGTPTSGNLSNCTADGTNSVGYLTVPQNSQSAAYPIVLADSGKHIYHPSSDANARTFTIPANGTLAFPIGAALTFVNMSASVVTIAITTDTLYLAGAGTTGSRSLAQYGVATALKLTTTTWIISGTNLT